MNIELIALIVTGCMCLAAFIVPFIILLIIIDTINFERRLTACPTIQEQIKNIVLKVFLAFPSIFILINILKFYKKKTFNLNEKMLIYWRLLDYIQEKNIKHEHFDVGRCSARNHICTFNLNSYEIKFMFYNHSYAIPKIEMKRV